MYNSKMLNLKRHKVQYLLFSYITHASTYTHSASHQGGACTKTKLELLNTFKSIQSFCSILDLNYAKFSIFLYKVQGMHNIAVTR